MQRNRKDCATKISPDVQARIATESVSVLRADELLTAFLELESAIRGRKELT
jgi:hypothetical protein